MSLTFASDSEKYLFLARRAQSSYNHPEAVRYYQKLEEADPSNWEAAFYKVYHTSYGCTIGNISSAAELVTHCLKDVIALVKTHVPQDQQSSVLLEITKRCHHFADILLGTNQKHSSLDSYRTNNICSLEILITLGNVLEKAYHADNQYHKAIALPWEYAWELQEKHLKNPEALFDLKDRIFKYDAAYIRPIIQAEIDRLKVRLQTIDKEMKQIAQDELSNDRRNAFILIGIGAFTSLFIFVDAFLLGVIGIILAIAGSYKLYVVYSTTKTLQEHKNTKLEKEYQQISTEIHRLESKYFS